MKTKLPLPLLTVTSLIALTLSAPHGVLAKEKKSSASEATVAASPAANLPIKKARGIAYHGKVTSVDASTKSFMVGARTFKVTNNTTITKEGAPANLSDLTAGMQVSGSYWKMGDGSLEVKSVKIGGAVKKASAGTSKGAKKKD
jgi:hypothetical protein